MQHFEGVHHLVCKSSHKMAMQLISIYKFLKLKENEKSF